MENAGAKDAPEDAERRGLGTPATRAAILEKLVSAGFAERKKLKKAVYLIPTQIGNSLITVLPEQLQSPLLTAEWEQKLTAIARGEGDPAAFMAGISDMARELVKTYSHATDASTQGLVYIDGIMYEGTGIKGQSTLRKIDLENNKTLSMLGLDSQYFGEGITVYKDKIYQLTWTSQKAFVYDLASFTLLTTFDYSMEQGWGLTTMGDKLIMSDGSHNLYHLDPNLFSVVKTVEVFDNKGPVTNLNELEYINGYIWANEWLTDRIVIIDPQSGEVIEELLLPNLLTASERAKLDQNDDVLNGIAYNEKKGTIYVTGKHWPKLFEIKTF